MVEVFVRRSVYRDSAIMKSNYPLFWAEPLTVIHAWTIERVEKYIGLYLAGISDHYHCNERDYYYQRLHEYFLPSSRTSPVHTEQLI